VGLIDARSRADLTRRLLVTAAAVLTYRACTHVPLPGFDPQVLAHIEGMTVARVSIVALGVTPFISALTLVELAKVVVPQLRRWERSNPANRATLDRVVLLIALAAATAQAAGVALALEGITGLVEDPGVPFRLTCVASLVAGAAIVIWLANQISLRGIGSGAWLLFVIPVLADFPTRVAALADWQSDANLLATELLIGGAFAVLIFAAASAIVLAGKTAATQATCLWSVMLAQALLPLLLLPWLLMNKSQMSQVGENAGTILALAVFSAVLALFYARSLRLGGIDGPSPAFAVMIGVTLCALTLANLALPAIVERLIPRSGQLIILAVVVLSILLQWWQPETPRLSSATLDESDDEAAQSSGGNK
jgi:preprotein translocase subunit SecY